MLNADTEWQKIDFENQNIAYGKDMIFEFVCNAGKKSRCILKHWQS